MVHEMLKKFKNLRYQYGKSISVTVCAQSICLVTRYVHAVGRTVQCI